MMPSLRPRRSCTGLAAIAAVLVALAAAACAVPQDPPRSAPRREPRYEPMVRPVDAPAGTWGDRVLVEAAAIPAAWLTRDLDGVSSNPDAEDAAGYAVRVAVGNSDQSVGLLAQGFHGDDDEVDGGLDVGTLGLDTDVRTPLDREGPGWFFLRAGGGIGGAFVDNDDDPGTQLEAQLRLGLDFQPVPSFLLSASFGGIVIGHPGETEAYGTFVMLGGGLVF